MKRHSSIYWYGGILGCFFMIISAILFLHQKQEIIPQPTDSLAPIKISLPVATNEDSMSDGPIETTKFVSPNIPTVTWHEWPSASRLVCGTVLAAVVNHHILASDLLGRSFSWLQFCRPDIRRVVILSPDHFLRGKTFVSTHIQPYSVSGNLITSDVPAITKATSTLAFVQEQPELFASEHGVGAIIPFVARAWPRAAIASFAIRSDLTRADAMRFVKLLKTMLDDETIFIVSSDMSHYLTRNQALANDEQTRQAFRTNNAEFFWRANDDFTDNGKSIWITLQSIESTSWNEQGHQISTDYDGSSNNTTSYLTGWWKKK